MNRRVLASILAILMLFSVLPLAVFAADDTGDAAPTAGPTGMIYGCVLVYCLDEPGNFGGPKKFEANGGIDDYTTDWQPGMTECTLTPAPGVLDALKEQMLRLYSGHEFSHFSQETLTMVWSQTRGRWYVKESGDIRMYLKEAASAPSAGPASFSRNVRIECLTGDKPEGQSYPLYLMETTALEDVDVAWTEGSRRATVTLKESAAQKFVNAYNAEYGETYGTHSLNGVDPLSIDYIYTQSGWTPAMAGTVFHVDLDHPTEPTIPAAPTGNDLAGLVPFECSTNRNHGANLPLAEEDAANATIEKVNDVWTLTAELDRVAYFVKYRSISEVYKNHSMLLGNEQTYTLMLNWNETTQKWVLPWQHESIHVYCSETIPTPSAANIDWSGFTVKIDCATVPAHSAKEFNVDLLSLGDYQNNLDGTGSVNIYAARYLNALNVTNYPGYIHSSTEGRLSVKLTWDSSASRWKPTESSVTFPVSCVEKTTRVNVFVKLVDSTGTTLNPADFRSTDFGHEIEFNRYFVGYLTTTQTLADASDEDGLENTEPVKTFVYRQMATGADTWTPADGVDKKFTWARQILFTDLEKRSDDVYNLYGQIIAYKLTLDTDGGKLTEASPEGYYLSGSEVDLPTAEKPGYKFLRWEEQGFDGGEDGGVIVMSLAETIEVSYDVTYKAIYEEIPAPAKPTQLNGTFSFHCVAGKGHSDLSPGWDNSDYSISEVQGDAVNGYYVVATVDVSKYLGEYSSFWPAEGKTHWLCDEADKVLTIYFDYDANDTGVEWLRWKQRGEGPVVNVTCVQPGDVTPDFTDANGQIRVQCVAYPSNHEPHSGMYGITDPADYTDYGMSQDANGEYIYSISLVRSRFISRFDTATEHTHVDKDSTADTRVEWRWDVQTSKWALISDDGVAADIQCECYYYNVHFLDEDGREIYSPQRVKKGDTVEEPEDPKKTGYKFLGWVEHTPLISSIATQAVEYFDFTTPITHTTMLYAQWELRTDIEYKVNYVEAGTNKVLQAPTTVSGQTFGTTVPVAVPAIHGYNPVQATASITLDKETGNEITLYYTARTDITYTVRYMQYLVNVEIAPAKVVTGQTYGTTVTESAIDILYYIPFGDTVKTLTLDTENNEIIFYYTYYNPFPPILPPQRPQLNTADHYAYVMGYPDGTVRPEESITRAEVATIFFRLLTDESRAKYWTSENSFSDVNAGDWFNNAISTLANAGIVNGYADGTFRPNAPITRGEMAKVVAQFATLDTTSDIFSDISGHWSEAYINLAAGNGWINGYPDGSFKPEQSITRAETMTMINRVLNRVPADASRLLPVEQMVTFPDCAPDAWYYVNVQEATNSHTYERKKTEKNGDENWIGRRDNKDWTQLEG